ncbi:MAG: CPBP family intramembrane metalloprotease [Phycisphaerales bacterium]|nr:CPBP family intramembrane metalloprotease [Phycisphaerales bacterium]
MTTVQPSASSALPDTTGHGMLDLHHLPEPTSRTRARVALAVGLGVLAWLGAVAFLSQYRPSQVGALLGAVAPHAALYWAATAAALVLAGALAAARRLESAAAAAMVAAFLLGHTLFALPVLQDRIRMPFPLRTTQDAIDFSIFRLAYLLALAAPMMLVLLVGYRLVLRSTDAFALGVGNWGVRSSDITQRSPRSTWRAHLIGFGLFAVVLFIMGQAFTGFAHLRSGVLLSTLPAVLLAALVNAGVEEVIYRGLLQPAFVRLAGVAAGIWTTALTFGLMHWGLSVGVVAALPTSLAIGVGSVLWGKAALETRGLSWVWIAHAMVDVAIMSAFMIGRA